jgi:hypothetical protein
VGARQRRPALLRPEDLPLERSRRMFQARIGCGSAALAPAQCKRDPARRRPAGTSKTQVYSSTRGGAKFSRAAHTGQ